LPAGKICSLSIRQTRRRNGSYSDPFSPRLAQRTDFLGDPEAVGDAEIIDAAGEAMGGLFDGAVILERRGSAALGPGVPMSLESRGGPNVRSSRWFALIKEHPVGPH
jgi:hypothetical protein